MVKNGEEFRGNLALSVDEFPPMSPAPVYINGLPTTAHLISALTG